MRLRLALASIALVAVVVVVVALALLLASNQSSSNEQASAPTPQPTAVPSPTPAPSATPARDPSPTATLALTPTPPATVTAVPTARATSTQSAGTPIPPTATASATPAVANTPGRSAPPPTPAPTVTPLQAPLRQISGLFAEARPVVANLTVTPDLPASVFPDYKEGDVVIYDTVDGTANDLGPGTRGVFIDDHRFTYSTKSADGRSTEYVYDAGARNSTRLDDLPGADADAIRAYTPAGRMILPDGMSFVAPGVDPSRDECRNTAGMDGAMCRVEKAESRYIVDATGRVLYSFKALEVRAAGPGELLIATLPVCEKDGALRDCQDLLASLGSAEPDTMNDVWATGTTNIFVLDLQSGEATFVATAAYNPLIKANNESMPLAADANYVAWTDNYCESPHGKTRIFNREDGTVTDLDKGYFFDLRNGILGLGEFGAKALLDPSTMTVTVALPANVPTDVSWSTDYRYAGTGTSGGHGGLCR